MGETCLRVVVQKGESGSLLHQNRRHGRAENNTRKRMIPKSKRLTRKGIDWLFRRGKRIRTPHGVFVYHASGAGVGVSVSKKVAKSAVVRNRLRRQMYDAFSAVAPHFEGGVMWNYAGETEPSFDELKEAAQYAVRMFHNKK